MNCRPSRPRIYLAGPDVFLPDSSVRFAELKAACARHEVEGIEPSDGDIPADFAGDDDARAHRIYEGNILRIRQADAVLANLCDFRGLEPDPGT
ncbi:MAG: nucleoside 2-deoxyribosyltransferase, partial [Comamonadaceae bacterium]